MDQHDKKGNQVAAGRACFRQPLALQEAKTASFRGRWSRPSEAHRPPLAATRDKLQQSASKPIRAFVTEPGNRLGMRIFEAEAAVRNPGGKLVQDCAAGSERQGVAIRAAHASRDLAAAANPIPDSLLDYAAFRSDARAHPSQPDRHEMQHFVSLERAQWQQGAPILPSKALPQVVTERLAAMSGAAERLADFLPVRPPP